MKKIDKLQKFLNIFTPSVYWATSHEGYEGKESRDIDVNDIDWNQTLITKINEVAARIYKDGTGADNGPETILISGHYSYMQGLIRSLLYFETDVEHHTGYYKMGKLAGRFDVLVIPALIEENKIYVCKLNDTTKDPFDVPNYLKVGVVKIMKQM